MRQIWTIARREWKSLLDQPTGYVLLVVFLGLNAFLFFRNAYLANVASLRPMMDLLPWMFLFFVPAVSMRSLAEDRKGGVLEIILAQPLSEAQLLLGKYLGVLLVLLSALAGTALIPIALELAADMQWGPILAQYAGAVLLAASFAAIGVFASSLTGNQITAFILAVAITFAIILIGLDPLLMGLPAGIGGVLTSLAVLPHFDSIGRGVLDLRDIVYFVALSSAFLVLAYAQLMRRRLSPSGLGARRLKVGTLLFIGVCTAFALAGSLISGRLDLSPGKAYTLSRATRDIVRGLDDVVTIKLYASRELPPEFALSKRDVNDLLRDLRAAGGGKIKVLERDPAADLTADDDAKTLGIIPVQFNVVGQSEYQVKEGYFGLAVQYAERHQSIPVIQRTDDLEYRILSAIRTLTRTTVPRVGIVVDPQLGTVRAFQGELARWYEVRFPNLTDTTPLGRDLQALVVATMRDSLDDIEASKIRNYLNAGGKLFVMESGMALSPEGPIARSRNVGFNKILSEYGVTINSDMVYDLRTAQVLEVPTTTGSVMRPYPLFMRARSTRLSPVNADIEEVSMAWTSSLGFSQAAQGTVTPLLITSPGAGADTGMAFIDPAREFSNERLTTRVLAAQIVPADSSARIVVVANALLATDDMLQRGSDGLLFALNAVDWLAQDEALISIRTRDRRPPILVFSGTTSQNAVKYANIALVPLLVVLYGAARLYRRRRLAMSRYTPRSSEA